MTAREFPADRPDDAASAASTANGVAAYRARLAKILGVTRQLGAVPAPAGVLLEETIAELQTVEDELVAQSDALFEAKLSVEARGLEFQLLFEYAPIAYFVTDAHGVVRDANIAATRLLNRTKNSLIGKPLAVHVPPHKRQAFRAAINHTLASRSAEEWPMRLMPTDDQEIDVVLTIVTAPQHAPGIGTLYWLVRRDQRRDTEDLL